MFPSLTLEYQSCWSTETYKLLDMTDKKARGLLYISNSYLRIIGYVFLLVLWYIKGVRVQEPI